MKNSFFWIFLFTIAGVSTANAQDKIALIGDSTVATLPSQGWFGGWGGYLKGALRALGKDPLVGNFAAIGRSSKSFYNEGRLVPAIQYGPDYLLIQFGHNDIRPEPEFHTQPATTYKTYLRMYIREARMKAIRPVLVTPPQQNVFKRGVLTDHLGPYAKAMRQVATEEKVPLVDLNAISRAWAFKTGQKGVQPYYADNIHFTEKGSKQMARWVAQELVKKVPLK